jgi:UDP-glucose 4-epimerase
LASLLILGAGYVGAALAELALVEGHAVTLLDNWYATDRAQLERTAQLGARVCSGDVRDRSSLDPLLAERPDRVYLLAAQASRPLAQRDPDYTEQTNVTGARRVAEAVLAAGGPALVYASSLHVYGAAPRGKVGPEHPYGEQGDLAHLSKVYGELCLTMYARGAESDLAILRLGIVYGAGPVEHADPASQTVIDKFRRLAATGEALPLDDGGGATIGAVHLDDATRILLDSPWEPGVAAANVAAETLTVADVAALARGETPAGEPACTFVTPFAYRHRVDGYLRP